jgi:hypothetical protein
LLDAASNAMLLSLIGAPPRPVMDITADGNTHG